MSSSQNHLRSATTSPTTTKSTSRTALKSESLVSALPILTKYAKIQPAVAIKPKPPGSFYSHKAAFNPQYDPQVSASNFFADDLATNVNVSRKWVLPARPRPGRKPATVTSPAVVAVTAASPEAVPDTEENDGLTKKRLKGPNISSLVETLSPPSPSGAGLPETVTETNLSAAPPTNTIRSSYITSSSGVSDSPVPEGRAAKSNQIDFALKPASKQIYALQEAYLAKLKERELIQNYIDTLSDQIKDLRFVQSGVITVNALSSTNNSKKEASFLQPTDQIDEISNVRDLDKFLAHQTTPSNVIRSGTKKYLNEGSGGHNPVQLQIEHYRRLRQRYRERQRGVSAKSLLILSQQGQIDESSLKQHQKIKHLLNEFLQKSGHVITSSSTSTTPGIAFTPSLLRPLHFDFFTHDDVTGVDSLDGVFLEKLKKEDSELELAPILKQASVQARKRLGCGFCSGETPCLCFDVDNLFGEK